MSKIIIQSQRFYHKRLNKQQKYFINYNMQIIYQSFRYFNQKLFDEFFLHLVESTMITSRWLVI